MPSFNYFKGFAFIRGIALLAVLLCLAAGDSAARTRKGDKFLKQAQQAEDAHKFDEAAGLYDQALDQDPTDVGYQLGSRRAHFEASQEHLKKGQKLRASGQLQPALVEFQRAFSLDASSAIAIEEMKTTMDMIDRNKKGNVPAAEQTLTPVQQEQKQITARLNEMQDVPRLKPISNEMHALTMNNQPPRVLYETVGKLAGINVIFDPQFNSPVKTADLDLSNTTLEQALDYIALLTHTFWQPISSNAIFVAEDNATKRRDYEDQVAKVFYLHNISTTQELQEVVNAVRTVTDLRRIFQYAALNAVIVRGNVGQVALAEKLFHDLDKPKSEVEVDVIILNANRSRTRNLTASIIDAAAGAAGLGVPIAFTPRSFLQPSGTTTTPTTPTTTPGTTPATGGGQSASPIVLGNIGKLSFSDFSTILPNAMLQAVMTDNSTKVLQSPQIRVSDGQKATLKIGQKYPYATGSFQPGIGTVGVSPLVSTQFQFADLGVTVEMTPHVNGNDQVTLHVAITIASHDGDITNSGLTQPILGNKQDETDIRLKDGEVSLLGGLLNTEVDSNVAGIPGLVNIPVLGHFLFGAENKTNQRGELLIALIPHILRKPDLSPSDLRGVEAGTDQVVRVSYAEPSEPPAAPVPVPPAPQPAQPSVMGAPRVAFSPGTIQAHVGDPVPVILQMQDAHDLASAPVKIKWDPKLLRLNQVSPGALFTQDGRKVNAPIDIRNDIGEATITMSRPTGAPGVNGSGAVAVYQFVAVGHGSGNITVTELGAKDSKQESIPLTLPALPVAVQ